MTKPLTGTLSNLCVYDRTNGVHPMDCPCPTCEVYRAAMEKFNLNALAEKIIVALGATTYDKSRANLWIRKSTVRKIVRETCDAAAKPPRDGLRK